MAILAVVHKVQIVLPYSNVLLFIFGFIVVFLVIRVAIRIIDLVAF